MQSQDTSPRKGLRPGWPEAWLSWSAGWSLPQGRRGVRCPVGPPSQPVGEAIQPWHGAGRELAHMAIESVLWDEVGSGFHLSQLSLCHCLCLDVR